MGRSGCHVLDISWDSSFTDPSWIHPQGVLDVSGASPRRRFFQVLAHFTQATDGSPGSPAEVERERLLYFASVEGRDDLYRYNQREGRTVLEVLQDFRACRPPIEWLLETCPLMKPRQYSIASSARCGSRSELHSNTINSLVLAYVSEITALWSNI